VVACDVSADALSVAALNRGRLGLDRRVRLVRGDLLTWLAGQADLILANLPYLPPTRAPELMPEVAGYEPHLALFAQGNGLGLILRLLADARRAVRPGCTLLLELDPDQVKSLQAAVPWARTTVLRDLMGNERVVRVDVP
jgi:release factor glutamine methyltransferase